MKRYILFPALLLAFAVCFSGCDKPAVPETSESIRIGFIGPITGPAAKYGADKAALLALEEINAAGGVNGQKLEFIMEDGRCEAKDALDAINKLINVDNVQVVLGGHCSPETVAIAPVAEQNQVLLLASLSSNPDIRTMGDYVFRTTAESVARVPNTTQEMRETYNIEKLAILSEETSYARPIADGIAKGFEARGGSVVAFESILPEDKDFRSQLLKVKQENPDAIYISTQAPDKAILILQQMQELGMEMQIFGNESVGSIPLIEELGESANGILFDSALYDKTQPEVAQFIEKYQSRYGSEPPYGLLTAESYDAVYIIAQAIDEVGTDPEKVRDYLYSVKEYHGASGTFGFDENGDVKRRFILSEIRDGRIVQLAD
ncbi:ABC transporter substrate-binding protein [Candidatus Nomurabacteria bacterium]|nr:ABC transporter substrate-binding protein [Candidatus Nomurabacteria bacterium]